MKKDFLIKLPAIFVLLLGLTVITGWLAHIQPLISFVPGYINMVFNTALCFCLASIALLLPKDLPKLQFYGRIILGSFIVLWAALIISQDIFNYNLGIDQFFVKVWLPDQNPFPGRMARNTAIAFICSGFIIMLMPYSRHRIAAHLMQILILGVLLIGFSAFIGYLLDLEFLYDWYRYARMAVHTTLGFIVLSIGFWLTWFKSEEYRLFYQNRKDKQILFVAATILFFVALIAGLAGFAISSQQSEILLEKALQQTLYIQKINFVQMLNESLSEVINLQDADALQQLAQKQSSNANDKVLLTELMNAVQFSSVQIYNTQNKLLASVGNSIEKSDLLIPINLPFAAKLLWRNGLYIRFTAPIINQGIEVGYFTTEWPLNFAKQITDVAELGETAELVVCAYHDKNHAICLPTNKTAKPFQLPFLQNGQRLPMWYALLGQSNTKIAEDYHRQQVIAAYSPIDNLGLGMVTKINTAEIYQPIRVQLQGILPLIVLTIIVGVILLYWQVLPLIRRITSSEKRLSASEAYLKAIINNMADGIIIINEQGKIESINPKILKIFKCQVNNLLGNDITLFMPLNLRKAQQASTQRYVIMNGTNIIGKNTVEMVARRQTGEQFPIELGITEIKLENKYLFVSIVRDISARKAAQAVLFESEARFRTAFDDAAIGMAIVSLEGQWLRVNQALCHILGYTETELLMTDFQSVTHPEDLLNDAKHKQQLIADEIQHYNVEKRYLHKNKSIVWILLSVSLIRDSSNKPLYFIMQMQDITSRKHAEARLKEMAYSDALTGLANRAQLENNLKIALANALRHQQRLAIIFLDLDGFKNINDTLGHDAGDQLLQTIARRLKACMRKTDTVARMGGDEFVLVITEVANIEAIVMVAQKILAEIANPILVKGYELHITTSIGISCYPDDGQDVEALLKNADMALYQAKLLGRNNYQFCTKEMAASAQEKLTKEQALRQALAKNELILHYQPIVDINTKKIIGVEALLRWDSPEFGLLGSADIIPLAEDTGLIYVIGDWVLKNACQQLAQWHTLGLNDLRLSINISPRQFKHLNFIHMVSEIIKKTQIPVHNLEFQVTENLFVNNPQYNFVIFQELISLGVKIAIDNFGTGYSSLRYMQQLAINRINIDRTFVSSMLTDAKSIEVVKAAIAMAKQLDIRASAEGVENSEQYNLLLQYGCSEVQGYFISVPLPIEQITAFLMRYCHSAISFLS